MPYCFFYIMLAAIMWLNTILHFAAFNKTLIEKGCMKYNKTTGDVQFKEEKK